MAHVVKNGAFAGFGPLSSMSMWCWTTYPRTRPRRCSAGCCATADIEAWAATWDENPTPFVWHKTAEQILERLAGYCTAVTAENLSASS